MNSHTVLARLRAQANRTLTPAQREWMDPNYYGGWALGTMTRTVQAKSTDIPKGAYVLVAPHHTHGPGFQLVWTPSSNANGIVVPADSVAVQPEAHAPDPTLYHGREFSDSQIHYIVVAANRVNWDRVEAAGLGSRTGICVGHGSPGGPWPQAGESTCPHPIRWVVIDSEGCVDNLCIHTTADDTYFDDEGYTLTEVSPVLSGPAKLARWVHEGGWLPLHGSEGSDPAKDPVQECGVSITLGAHSDPYGATCTRRVGHEGKHRAPDPMGGPGTCTWRGGGSCVGDPLPYTELEFHDQAPWGQD